MLFSVRGFFNAGICICIRVGFCTPPLCMLFLHNVYCFGIALNCENIKGQCPFQLTYLLRRYLHTQTSFVGTRASDYILAGFPSTRDCI